MYELRPIYFAKHVSLKRYYYDGNRFNGIVRFIFDRSCGTPTYRADKYFKKRLQRSHYFFYYHLAFSLYLPRVPINLKHADLDGKNDNGNFDATIRALSYSFEYRNSGAVKQRMFFFLFNISK